MPKVIGITGYIGSGKTLVADYLCSQSNFNKLKMAQPIKDMLYAVGLGVDELEGSRKETPNILLCDKTPRFAMQTLGTEWGRQMLGDDVWVRLWENKATSLINMNHNIVSDDVRFYNEVATIRNMGGIVIRLTREGSNSIHPSEKQDFEVDHIVANDGTQSQLINKIEEIIRLTNTR